VIAARQGGGAAITEVNSHQTAGSPTGTERFGAGGQVRFISRTGGLSARSARSTVCRIASAWPPITKAGRSALRRPGLMTLR